MKKKYINPTTEVLDIKMQQILAGSLQFTEDGGSGTGTLEDGDAESDGLSKRSFSIWDDEE